MAWIPQRKPVHGVSVPHTHRWLAGRALAGARCRTPKKRNLAEYEGFLDIEESTINELRAVAAQLIDEVFVMVGGAGV